MTFAFERQPSLNEIVSVDCAAFSDASCTSTSGSFFVVTPSSLSFSARNASVDAVAASPYFMATLRTASTRAFSPASSAAHFICCSLTSSTLAASGGCLERGNYKSLQFSAPIVQLSSNQVDVLLAFVEEHQGQGVSRFSPFLVPFPCPAGDCTTNSNGVALDALNPCGTPWNTSGCNASAQGLFSALREWLPAAWSDGGLSGAAAGGGAEGAFSCATLPSACAPQRGLTVTAKDAHILLITKNTTQYAADLVLVLGGGVRAPLAPNWVAPLAGGASLLSFTIGAYDSGVCSGAAFFFCKVTLTLISTSPLYSPSLVALGSGASSANPPPLSFNLSATYPAWDTSLSLSGDTDFVAGYVGGEASSAASGFLAQYPIPQACTAGICFSAQCSADSGFLPVLDCAGVTTSSTLGIGEVELGVMGSIPQLTLSRVPASQAPLCAWGFTAQCRNCSNPALEASLKYQHPRNSPIMICPGGKNILLNPGFWAPLSTSAPQEVEECLPGHCTGSFTYSPSAPGGLSFDPAQAIPSSCFPPYRGFKCGLCAEGYAPRGTSCSRCPKGLGEYLSMLVTILQIVGVAAAVGAALYLLALMHVYWHYRSHSTVRQTRLSTIALPVAKNSTRLVIFFVIASQSVAGLFSSAINFVKGTELEPYYEVLSSLQLKRLDISMQCYSNPYTVMWACVLFVAAVYLFELFLFVGMFFVFHDFSAFELRCSFFGLSRGAGDASCCPRPPPHETPRGRKLRQINDAGIVMRRGFAALSVLYGAITQQALDYVSCTSNVPMTFYEYAINGGDGSSLGPGMPSVAEILAASDPWNVSFGMGTNYTLTSIVPGGGISMLVNHPGQVCNQGSNRPIYTLAWCTLVFFSLGYPAFVLYVIYKSWRSRLRLLKVKRERAQLEEEMQIVDVARSFSFMHSTFLDEGYNPHLWSILHSALSDPQLSMHTSFFMPLHQLVVATTFSLLAVFSVFQFSGFPKSGVSVKGFTFISIMALHAVFAVATKFFIRPFEGKGKWQNTSFMGFSVLAFMTAGCRLYAGDATGNDALAVGTLPLVAALLLFLTILYKWRRYLVPSKAADAQQRNLLNAVGGNFSSKLSNYVGRRFSTASSEAPTPRPVSAVVSSEEAGAIFSALVVTREELSAPEQRQQQQSSGAVSGVQQAEASGEASKEGGGAEKVAPGAMGGFGGEEVLVKEGVKLPLPLQRSAQLGEVGGTSQEAASSGVPVSAAAPAPVPAAASAPEPAASASAAPPTLLPLKDDYLVVGGGAWVSPGGGNLHGGSGEAKEGGQEEEDRVFWAPVSPLWKPVQPRSSGSNIISSGGGSSARSSFSFPNPCHDVHSSPQPGPLQASPRGSKVLVEDAWGDALEAADAQQQQHPASSPPGMVRQQQKQRAWLSRSGAAAPLSLHALTLRHKGPRAEVFEVPAVSGYRPPGMDSALVTVAAAISAPQPPPLSPGRASRLPRKGRGGGLEGVPFL